jgi:hypothetical protein
MKRSSLSNMTTVRGCIYNNKVKGQTFFMQKDQHLECAI